MTAIPEDEMDNDLFGATEMTEGQLRQRLGIDPNQTPGSLPTPTPSTPPQPCAHLRTTKQGSNDKQKVVKCKDCGATLMTEKLSPSEKMKTNSPQECQRGQVLPGHHWHYVEMEVPTLWTHGIGREKPR